MLGAKRQRGVVHYGVQKQNRYRWESIHKTFKAAKNSVVRFSKKHPQSKFWIYRWDAKQHAALYVKGQ